MAANGISTLSTKEERQLAKLNLAQTKRQLTGTPGRVLKYYDVNLLPTKYVGNDVVNNPNVGGLQQGRPWKTTPNILSGLWRTHYNNFWQGDPAFFDNNSPASENEVADFSVADIMDQYISVQWLGYFRAPHTANYQFYMYSDDDSAFWLGNDAITAYTLDNSTLFTDAPSGEVITDPIPLVEGQYYPIRIQYGNNAGEGYFTFSWSDDLDIVQTGLSVRLVPADYATTPSPGTWVNRQTDFPIWNAGTGGPITAPTYHTVDTVCWEYAGENTAWDILNPTTGDFTASIWFNTMSTAGSGSHFYDNPALIGGDVPGPAGDWGMVIANGRVGIGAYSGQTVFTTSQYNDGNWHCATVTRVKTTGVMMLYINGVLQTQMTEASGIELTDSDLIRLGGDPTNTQWYTGFLGEFDFWQLALTAEQIASNFAIQRGIYGV